MPTFQIQFRRDTTANWESCNPVLLPGELGLEFKEDGTRLFKIGDGNTAWMDLPYCSGPKGDKFEFSDFTPEQLEMLKGPKGDAFVYSDFTPAQLAALVGPKGDDGTAPEHKWEGTTLQFKNADGTWGQAVDLKGPKGDTTVSALPIATDSVLGGVKVSTGLSVTADGTVTVNKATATPKAPGTATVGSSDKFAPEDHVHPAQSVPAAATATPKAPGTAAVGTSAKYAREDHVHALQTSVSGNAGTATKLAAARKINGVSFDGSADITINAGVVSTIIYPNGGTKTNPANVAKNNKYTLNNPYPGYCIYCKVQLLINNKWADVFLDGYTGAISSGVEAKHMLPDDVIVVITGKNYVSEIQGYGGYHPADTSFNLTSAPCRVIVTRLGAMPN